MNKEINTLNDCRGMSNQEIVEAVLETREIRNVEDFLNPSKDYLLPLGDLYRIDEAADIIIDGMKNNKKFFVNVDSDTDGVMSGTCIIRYLKSMGCYVNWYVSKKKTHGTSEGLLESLREQSPDILIIVDSLDTDIDNYKLISEMGIKTIVLDHHDISSETPYDKYVVLVSSNRKYGNKQLSGAGVTWKMTLYLDSILGTIESLNLVDLAGCGIASDMSDVSEDSMENRAIINMGLNNLQNPAMKKIVGSYEFNSNSFLYSVAPLINASCRYNKNDDAVHTFLSDENKVILKHLKVLKGCKEAQEEEVGSLLPDVIEQAEEQIDNKLIVVIIDTDSGISGLIANKLLEIYQRPIMVLKENYGGYSGSCRSIGCGNFNKICTNTGLIEVGGHPESFGVINLSYNNFDEFRNVIEGKLKDIELKTELNVDAKINIEDINKSLIDEIKDIDRISGNGFKPISFLINCWDYECETMSKGKHLVVKPSLSEEFQFIKWNSGGLLEDYETHQLCEDELTLIGTLDCGYLGRKFGLRMIVNKIIVD